VGKGTSEPGVDDVSRLDEYLGAPAAPKPFVRMKVLYLTFDHQPEVTGGCMTSINANHVISIHEHGTLPEVLWLKLPTDTISVEGELDQVERLLANALS
jgi:hypothetical protein